MPLSQEQRAALERAAADNGVDPAALIEVADAELAARDAPPNADAAAIAAEQAEPPKLFQYHLPFVRVREVRRVWLRLEEPFPGDDEIAAEWAAKFTGPATSQPPDEPA